jgi:hypothetical protein
MTTREVRGAVGRADASGSFGNVRWGLSTRFMESVSLWEESMNRLIPGGLQNTGAAVPLAFIVAFLFPSAVRVLLAVRDGMSH